MTNARDFGPLALKAVQEKMIQSCWTRKLINQRVGRIRRVFKWAAAEQLVPIAVHQALAAVPGLQAGRTKARGSPPVEHVAVEHVEATLPYLNRQVAGIVRFQMYTGWPTH
jgi:hypothetical protein